MLDMDEKILELYEKYESCREVAEQIGINGETVRRALIKHGVPRTHRHPKPLPKRACKKVEIDVEEAAKMYADGMTLTDIGNMFECNYQTVRRRLSAAGVEMRHRGPNNKVEIDANELYRLRCEGISTEQIAKEFNTTRDVIVKRCIEYGIVTGKGNVLLKPVTSICGECGEVFETCKRDALYCSRACQNKHSSRLRDDRKRTNTDGSIENISLREVYERDSGICHICGGMTDWSDFTIDDDGNFIAGSLYPSRDHVVPLSKGGEHTLSNVKLAHFWCNSVSGDKIEKVGLHDPDGGRYEERHAPGTAQGARAGDSGLHRHGRRVAQHGAARQAVPRDDPRDRRAGGRR